MEGSGKKENVRIAVDVNGGDNGEEVNVRGVIDSLKRIKDLELLLLGDADKICKILKEEDVSIDIADRITPNHTNLEDEIPMDIDNPLRVKKSYPISSLIKAIKSTATGNTNGVISAGNSGALAYVGLTILKRIEKNGSYAFATTFPSINNRSEETLLVDLGASKETSKEQMIKNTFMAVGSIKSPNSNPHPIVGILCSGKNPSELETEVFNELKEIYGNYFFGYVSETDLLNNECDVITMSGFDGNIVLKTSEGAAPNIIKKLSVDIKSEIKSILLGLGLKGISLGLINKNGLQNLLLELNKDILELEVISGKETIIPNISGLSETSMLNYEYTDDENELDKIYKSILIDVYNHVDKYQSRPKIGIINNGTEESKGRNFEKKLLEKLKDDESSKNISYIEPNNLLSNDYDIVITDTRIAKKVINTIKGFLIHIVGRIDKDLRFGDCTSKEKLKKRLKDGLGAILEEADKGALFIGPNGYVAKVHGSCNAKAFSRTIDMLYHAIKKENNKGIESEIILQEKKKSKRIEKEITIQEERKLKELEN